jgi:hypothetical protein
VICIVIFGCQAVIGIGHDTKNIAHPSAIDALRKGCLHDLKTRGWSSKSSRAAKELEICPEDSRPQADPPLDTRLLPAHSIADARKWADEINEQVEKGVNPRDVERRPRSRPQDGHMGP